MTTRLPVGAAIWALSVFLAAHVSAAPIVLPGSATAAEGSSNLTGPLANADLTFQWVFAESELASLPAGRAINAIGFRLNGGALDGPALPSVFADWTLQVSRSANAPGSLRPSFAANIGADAVTVRSGPLTIPANALTGGAGPNPFYFIPFSTPYTYVGGDLLFTLRQDASSGVSILPLDALPLTEVTGIGDTVRAAGANAVQGQAQFSNIPVTALRVVPEPASLVLMVTGLAAGAFARLRPRTRRQFQRPYGPPGGRASGALAPRRSLAASGT